MDKYKEEECMVVSFKKLEVLENIPPGTKAVDAHKNQISRISVGLGSGVEYVDVSDNLLRSMDEFSPFSNLITLDCGFNMITEIKQLEGKRLKHLYLMCNYIKRMENIRYEKLSILDIAGNEIEKIENIESADLEELYLSSNKICKVECVSNLNKLRILDLTYNQLEKIDCMDLPESLEILLLHGNNELFSIEHIEHLKKLKTIGIRNTLLVKRNFPKTVDVWM